MKTAEEWSIEINSDNALVDTTGRRLQFHSEVMLEQVKQIQLDAWKQGMTHAANICRPMSDWCGGYGEPPMPDSSDYVNAILKARDAKTTL